MSGSTSSLQRSRTIRHISRPASSSQHPGPFHRGDAESFRLCDEGGELLAAKREIIRLEGILEAKQREEELSSGSDRKRIRRSTGGRCDGEQQGLHAAPRQASPRLRSLAARARATLEVCQGPSSKVFVVPAPGYFNAWNNEIASWLTTNLRQKRKHRQKQLWIQGPGGIGKTTLVTMLEEIYSLSIYRWPKDERWWDLYGDGQYDLIVLDEFRSQKMITELNPILSGDPTTLSRRGMSPITKRDILPVIIMSNYTPEECFPSANEHGKLEPCWIESQL